jgi:tartrate dehydratase beta subunit/fumarate hydratase class I family protein
MRRAQTYARAVRGDSTWGIQITSASQVVLYKGASYATRDAAFDETIPLSSNISTSFNGEVIFAKLTATPSITGSFTFTSSPTNASRLLSLNAEGMVDY